MTRRQEAVAFVVAFYVLLVTAAVLLNITWVVINARSVTPRVFGIVSFALIILETPQSRAVPEEQRQEFYPLSALARSSCRRHR